MISSHYRPPQLFQLFLLLKFSPDTKRNLVVDERHQKLCCVDSSATKKRKTQTLNSDDSNNNNFLSFYHEFLRQTPRQSIFIESLEGREGAKDFSPPLPLPSSILLPFFSSSIDLAHSSRSER